MSSLALSIDCAWLSMQLRTMKDKIKHRSVSLALWCLQPMVARQPIMITTLVNRNTQSINRPTFAKFLSQSSHRGRVGHEQATKHRHSSRYRQRRQTNTGLTWMLLWGSMGYRTLFAQSSKTTRKFRHLNKAGPLSIVLRSSSLTSAKPPTQCNLLIWVMCTTSLSRAWGWRRLIWSAGRP